MLMPHEQQAEDFFLHLQCKYGIFSQIDVQAGKAPRRQAKQSKAKQTTSRDHW
jgi:hypothetical protein